MSEIEIVNRWVGLVWRAKIYDITIVADPVGFTFQTTTGLLGPIGVHVGTLDLLEKALDREIEMKKALL